MSSNISNLQLLEAVDTEFFNQEIEEICFGIMQLFEKTQGKSITYDFSNTELEDVVTQWIDDEGVYVSLYWDTERQEQKRGDVWEEVCKSQSKIDSLIQAIKKSNVQYN